jgi:hypothetical protein
MTNEPMTNEQMTNDQLIIGIWDLVIESLIFGIWSLRHWSLKDLGFGH